MEAKSVKVTLLVDEEIYYVSAQIDGEHFELDHYDDVNAAAMRMNDWIRGHGLEWAKDSARRVDAAQLADAKILILDAVPVSPETRARNMAWVPYAIDYIWQL
jgi:hypothetical protein